MRFSTLTIVVFVAHTSTLAIAAPLPVPGDVQDLVVRTDDNPPAPSRGSSGFSAGFKQVMRFTKVPIPNNVASVVQKVVGLAATYRRPSPSSPSPALQKARSALSKWKKKTSSSAFKRPGGSSFAVSGFHKASASMRKGKEHSVTSALRQLHNGFSTRKASSPSRRGSSAGRKLKKRDLEIEELD